MYNWIGMPSRMFELDEQKYVERYVKPRVRTDQYRMILNFGERFSREDYRRQQRRNEEVEARAVKEVGGRAIRDFLKEHPEYGFRPLPTYDAGGYSIYPTTSLYPVFTFYSEDVGKECKDVTGRVEGLVGRLFTRYDKGQGN